MRIDCDSHFLPKDIFDDVDPRCGPSARIEELGVPLIVHPSRNGNLLGLERLEKFHLDNALGFLYEGTLAITSIRGTAVRRGALQDPGEDGGSG